MSRSRKERRGGWGRIELRHEDFSPLLCQLSYPAVVVFRGGAFWEERVLTMPQSGGGAKGFL